MGSRPDTSTRCHARLPEELAGVWSRGVRATLAISHRNWLGFEYGNRLQWYGDYTAEMQQLGEMLSLEVEVVMSLRATAQLFRSKV